MAVVCPKGHADVQAQLDNFRCLICGAVFTDPPEKKKGKK